MNMATFSFFSFAEVIFFHKKHGCALARVTAVPFENEKKTCFLFFFSFTRVTVLLPREARLCFRESHGRASRKGKKIRIFCFFSFVRVTVLLSREVRLCFRESHGRASRKRKKMCFLFFSFHESHGFASTRGTVVIS